MLQEDFAALIAGLQSEGHSRADIARGSGLSRTTVWRIAEGEIRHPGYETIVRLKYFAESNRSVSDMKQG